MGNLFLEIINMSLTASYVILFVIVVRVLLKKAPKVFSYVLWSVVFFRLIFPFTFEGIFSLIPFNQEPIPQKIIYAETPQIQSGITIIDKTVNSYLPGGIVEASVNPIQMYIAIGAAIWLLGIAVLLIYSIFTALRLSSKLNNARPLYDNVYEVGNIKTPFVFGVRKPKIYLPVGLSDNEKDYIIKHEETHIKRFDHLIKPLAFLVVCVHWFNPLVWAAFLLMSNDMELSCDEKVLEKMGSGIKKDYSSSLLSLSSGRRIIGGCPLAFGENNVKGRIMNILNYRKPKFWIIVAAVVLVAGVSVGLLSSSQKANLTIEDYANQYIQQEINMLESFDHPLEGIEANNLKVIDSKITKLELAGTFNNLLPYPVEIWRLEYRLKPDDINNVVLAGGMSEEDGWITESSSMGKPMMVFSYENSNKDNNPEYLGELWDGERDLSNLAGQETALRIFLEDKGLLPHETFGGNHVLVKFPLSTGENCQMFLSQPIIQGDSGFWWVERWMDGNGTIHYETPKTDKMILNYFEELQMAVDKGQKQELLDPMKVALEWANSDLGLGQNVKQNQLELKYSATSKDFMQTPESTYLGYISDFTTGDNSTPYFHLDQIEWLTLEDADRLKALDIDPNDLPNGYYIHNPNDYPMFHQVKDETTYSIIDWKGNAKQKNVTLDQFVESLEVYSEQGPPYWVFTKDGYVKSITEQYIP
jgi:beta-lactamase regulating signal transducer with metallopeptidase domain